MSTPAYTDREHPDHAAAVARVASVYEAAEADIPDDRPHSTRGAAGLAAKEPELDATESRRRELTRKPTGKKNPSNTEREAKVRELRALIASQETQDEKEAHAAGGLDGARAVVGLEPPGARVVPPVQLREYQESAGTGRAGEPATTSSRTARGGRRGGWWSPSPAEVCFAPGRSCVRRRHAVRSRR